MTCGGVDRLVDEWSSLTWASLTIAFSETDVEYFIYLLILPNSFVCRM